MGFITQASAADLYTRFYSDVPDDVFKALIYLDPTFKGKSDGPQDVVAWREGDFSKPMGKYGKQLMVWYRKGDLNGTDFHYIRTRLEQYDVALSDLPQEYRSITKFTNFREFRMFCAHELPKIVMSVKAEKAKSEVDKVYEDEEWEVLIPLSHMASVYYGTDNWCTARPLESNYFNQYSREGTLYMIINKHNKEESFQLFVPKKGADPSYKQEVKDYEDIDVSVSDLPSSPVAAIRNKNSEFDTSPSVKEIRVDFSVEYGNEDSEVLVSAHVSGYAAGDSNSPVFEKYFDTEKVTVIPFNYKQWDPSSVIEVVNSTGADADFSKPGLYIDNIGSVFRMMSIIFDEVVPDFPRAHLVPGDQFDSNKVRGLIGEAKKAGATAPYIVMDCPSNFDENGFTELFHIIMIEYGTSRIRLGEGIRVRKLRPNSTKEVPLTSYNVYLFSDSDAGSISDAFQDPQFKKWAEGINSA